PETGATESSTARSELTPGPATSESFTPSGHERDWPALPSSLYASPEAAETPAESSQIAPPPYASRFTADLGGAIEETPAELESAPDEKESAFAEPPEILAGNGTSLTDEDVSALAEQLAEAKHEEAQGEAEEIEEAAEAALEPFVDASELEELQDALQEDHEEAAAEAEAAADEMHEEAMASEESADHEELNGAEHEGAHEEEHEEEHEAPLEGEHAEFAESEGGEGEPEHETSETLQASSEEQHEQQPTSARISDRPRARFQRPMRRGERPNRGRRGGRPNDRRPHQHTQHGHPRHEAHRRPQLISEMLKAGEEIIVQIAKEPLGKKGARITSHVALPGRFLVYMPTVDHIGVSRRIGSAEDRSRLRRVVTEAKGTFPGGFIVRTAAAGATDDEIRDDVEFLGRTWDTIRATSEQRRAPSLLHRDLNLVERILRDYLSDDYAAIWLDNEEEYTKVVEFVGRFQPRMVPRVKLYTKETPIFEEFGIQQELDKALRPKVWLKSGGYIVINHTEALVAIDVNTGKYVGRGSTRLEDTIVKTNLEAVKEIVRQIRLRDLGGIIVCDFIDMEERRNRDKVMAALEQALTQDRAPSKALSFNEFGLVCITRKRTKQALERVLCQPCPYCTGSGMVKSLPTICYEVQAEARKMAADLDSSSIT
ncbi:MAG: Rne/Rng family ribonuclease, partial [Candidatus Acidiferrales bacterium]